MGIEYYLVNTKEKTVYEFGKGYWSSDAENYFNPEVLYQYVKDKFDSWHRHEEFSLYHVEIYLDIRKFLYNAEQKDVEIVNDCDDSDNMLRDQQGEYWFSKSYQGEYKEVGSRYREI